MTPEAVSSAPTGLRSPEGIRSWRTERGLSLRKLAKLLDVHFTTVYRWEAGQIAIPRTTELALKGLEHERLDNPGTRAKVSHAR